MLTGYDDFMKPLALTLAFLSPVLAAPLEGAYIGSVGNSPVVAVFVAKEAQFENS